MSNSESGQGLLPDRQ